MAKLCWKLKRLLFFWDTVYIHSRKKQSINQTKFCSCRSCWGRRCSSPPATSFSGSLWCYGYLTCWQFRTRSIWSNDIGRSSGSLYICRGLWRFLCSHQSLNIWSRSWRFVCSHRCYCQCQRRRRCRCRFCGSCRRTTFLGESIGHSLAVWTAAKRCHVTSDAERTSFSIRTNCRSLAISTAAVRSFLS